MPHADGHVTKFLALDKVLPNRHFLQVLSFPLPEGLSSPVLCYDPTWLAILRMTHSLDRPEQQGVPEGLEEVCPSEEDQEEIIRRYQQAYPDQQGGCVIPENFRPTQPAYIPGPHARHDPRPPSFEQTDELMAWLGLENVVHAPPPAAPAPVPSTDNTPSGPPGEVPQAIVNPEEIDLDDME